MQGCVFEDAFGSAFAAHAGLFYAAEWCCGVGDDSGVEAHETEFKPVGESPHAVGVFGEDVGCQAVFGGVGDADGFGFVCEGDDGCDGAEDFFLGDAHVAVNAGEDGGGVEVAVAFDGGAAGDCFGTFVYGVVDKRCDVVAGVAVDEWSAGDVVVEAVADVECCDTVGEFLGEFFGDAFVDDEPVGCGAGFADVAHFNAHGAFDGLVDVSVFEDDEWCVTTKLHRGAQDVVGSSFEQCLTHWGGAGEGDLAQAGISHQRGRDARRRLGRHYVDDTGGNTSVDHGLCEVLGGQRGELGWFDHHDAACGDGWGDLAMIGAVGNDPYADPALKHARRAGLDISRVAIVEGPTGLAVITVAADGENTIVVVPGANEAVTAEFVYSHAAAIGAAAIVLMQGEIPASGFNRAADLATGRIVINLAPVVSVGREQLLRADPLLVNEHEAALELHQLGSPATSDDPHVMAQELREQGFASVVLTLGAAGALVADASGLTDIPTPAITAVDSCGAGDAFAGALVTRMTAGDSLVDAALFAARVGASAATRSGAQDSYPSAGDPLPVSVG